MLSLWFLDYHYVRRVDLSTLCEKLISNRAGIDRIIVVAKSLVRLIPLGCREVRRHFERRRAVESSFRGPPPPSNARTIRSGNFWQPLYTNPEDWKRRDRGFLKAGAVVWEDIL